MNTQLSILRDMGEASMQSRFLLWSLSITLLLISSGAQRISPCPSVLRYQADGSMLLTIKPPSDPGSKIHLQVRLYTAAKETVFDGEELALLENKNELNTRILAGSPRPIKYKLPFTSRVPAVVKDIILNHRIVCENKNIADNKKKFEILVSHSFHPDGDALAAPISLQLGFECGRPDVTTAFIHRGDESTPGQWPWHVALYWLEGVNLNYKCGATLVTNKAVITAAHCVADSRGEAKQAGTLTVYLGKHRLSLWGDEVQAKEVQNVHIHPGYNSSTFHNDIAVLTLRTTTTFSVFIKPACIWGRPDDDLREIIGKLGYVVGWGRNEHDELEDSLKQGKIPVATVRDCLTSNADFNRFTTNTTFCAGYRNGTHNPCGGDSGGGMFFKPQDSEEWVLRGVVSTGAPKLVNGHYTCDPSHYVIFTDVTTYRDWIVNLII